MDKEDVVHTYRERQMPFDFSYMCKVKNKINIQTKQKETHRHREQTDSSQIGGSLWGWAEKVKGLKSTDW